MGPTPTAPTSMKPQAKTFKFCGYNFITTEKKVSFNYRVEFLNRDPLDFTETLELPALPQDLSDKSLQKFFESLSLILGISYYKLYCPPKIKIFFKLSQKQADFWNTTYKKGLGEFFYRNNLDPEKLAKFPYSKIKPNPSRISVNESALLGIGGGKDSIVAAKLLKDFKTTSFLVETQRKDTISENVIQKINNPSLIIKRTLDSKIFETYEGGYNGHIPISAVFAFVGLLAAAIYKHKYVIVANEHSSNFGNITYKGEEMNHQWSKSMEFEGLMQEYTREFITPDITYFSVLRQFYEIRVAKMFSECKEFFPLFTSCNRSFKAFKDRPDSLWCDECPKCAFVFLMLAPFISREELLNIFSKNLFANSDLIPLFNDILGFGNTKPFDCVGTFEEARVAFSMASKKFKDDIVIKTLLPKIGNVQEAAKKVFSTAPAPTLPTPFRFLGVENVCILGYGKEGHVTEKYLKEKYPHLKIGILDQSLDKDYLAKQNQYDLAIKTPGIQKRMVTIPYTTATNIFFSQNKNFTIGITGSKGKSTTSSLIYEIIKAAGRKVRFVGNIGNPMLGVLLEKVDPEEIFVIEMSSYMLDDIEYSPNIALLINLFPEHMDYHGSVEAYYSAKKNIFKFQKSGDFAVMQPFKDKIPLKRSEIPLLGQHNVKNIQAAIKVVRILNISNEAIAKAIKNFKPLPHRLELVGSFDGITFYDDAISTTPESTIEAIKSLKSVGTILLGGEDRGYDFHALEKVLMAYKIKNIVLFPESGARILTSKDKFNTFNTADMKKAVDFAFKNTPKGKICLLSTASPSYSLWKNFEEKGDLFQKYIKKHITKNPS